MSIRPIIGPMKIISTFHPTSSVLSSVKCRLSHLDVEHLIVAKLNRIDVYSARPYGLQHECGLDVWGKVCSVKALPLSLYDQRSNIVLMTTHPDPELIFLSYEEPASGKGWLAVQKQLSFVERYPRPAEFLTDFVVHPSGKMIVGSCYAGRLKVIILKGGRYVDDFDVSIPEINIFSLAFLPSEDESAIAVLFLDSQGRLQLCARDIDVETQELSMYQSLVLQPTIISNKVIPSPIDSPPRLVTVPPDAFSHDADNSFGGVLVVGGRVILFFDMTSKQSQERQRGKRKRLETHKNSDDPALAAKAKSKEMERSSRTRKSKASVEWPWSEVTAWTAIDQSHYLIGDAFGRLSMLSLSTGSMILIPLGQCSRPTTLTYLTNQVVYVGSHTGDSQLLRISPTPVSPGPPELSVPPEVKTVSQVENMRYPSVKKSKQRQFSEEEMDVDDDGGGDDCRRGRVISSKWSFITVLETYKNIAPIMDAILADPDRSGQAHIVTCSGGANTGSLNIIRNGTEFNALGFSTGLLNIVRIWAVKIMIDDLYHSHLVVSTLNRSHLFKLDSGGKQLRRIEPGAFNALVSSQPTLAFSNVKRRQNGSYLNSSLAVQVVPTSVYLLEWNSSVNGYVERHKWEPRSLTQDQLERRDIVSASVNASQIALALSGGNLVLLRIKNDAPVLELQTYNAQLKSEISAISLSPLNHQSLFTRHFPVAYWRTNTIEIFDVGTQLRSVVRSTSLPALVRSVLLYNFGSDSNSKGRNYHPYLLAGLANGSLATMIFSNGQLTELKVTSLGHTPVHLTPYTANERKCVFAIGNRATIIFVEKGRLTLSPVMLKEISAVTSVNTERFPSSLILTSLSGLFIGRVGVMNKLHIRSCPFGPDGPRRIVYEPLLRVYGVAFTREVPTRVGNFEPPRSSFKLISDNDLSVLAEYNCEHNEEITALASFMPIKDHQNQHFFCLGTFIFNPEELEPSSGRLLIFTPFAKPTQGSSMELAMLTSCQVNGCIFALKILDDKIVAAVNSGIVLYRLDIALDAGISPLYSLKKLADWTHNYLVTSLGSFGNHIIVGDQISSVSLIELQGEGLSLKARDYGPLYPVAVEALDNKSIICSNDTLNIYLFALNKHVRGDSLEVVGCYHTAEMVSKFVRGSVVSVDSYKEDSLQTESMLFTASGRICVIIGIQDDDISLRLTELQRNLANVISGVGGRNHSSFRAPKNRDGDSETDAAAYGFLDGDFLEQYLTLDTQVVEQVLEGVSLFERVTMSEGETVRVLERLRSLH